MSASVISGMGELNGISIAVWEQVGTGNLQVEHRGQEKHKACDGKIHPLDILESLFILASLQEEHIASKNWCHHRSNTIEGLRNIDT